MCLIEDSSLWKQLLILAAGCFHSFGIGIMLAYPSVMNSAILSPNTTDIKATPDQASWIASANGFSGLVSFFIFSPLLQIIGRKPINILFDMVLVTGWVIIYFSGSVTTLIVAKGIQGLGMGGLFVHALTINEFTHRQKRGIFITIKKSFHACGSLFCHFLAFFWDWRRIAALSVLPHLLSILILSLCPESPAFYAMKGKFEDCEKSFIWFHGKSDGSKKELKQLMAAQIERQKLKEQKKNQSLLLKLLKKILRKDFQTPLLISSFTTIALDVSGRYFLLSYVTEIMMKLTGDKYIAMYCSMIADVLLIIALLISTIVIKHFKRRIILIVLGGVSATLMFAVSLSIVLDKAISVSNSTWLTPFIILVQSFIAHIGLIPVGFAVTSEIFPLTHRGMGSFTTGIIFTLFYATTIKITPKIIETTGVEGTYCIFGTCLAFCLSVLYFILPETKDKTLQEIEDEIRGIKRTNAEVESIL